MATYEDIKMANRAIKPIDVKGKEYVEVNQRVTAFRMVHPNGGISSEIVSLADGVVVMKATCFDDGGNILGVGHAYEKENSSYINKTSYIENCETSAVGRALGMAGFGIDASICSAEELQNALLNQEGNETVSAKEASLMKKMLQATDSDTAAFLKMINDNFGRGAGSVDELTKKEYAFGLIKLRKKAELVEKGGNK